MDLISLTDVRPDVRGGKPCFVGTRNTVYNVLGVLGVGMTTDEIVGDLHGLTTDHVQVALAFAAMREHRLDTPT